MEKKMRIEGMKCEHCRMKVEKALKGVAGVEDAVVDLENKAAVIRMNTEVDDQLLADAVTAKGFTPVGFF